MARVIPQTFKRFPDIAPVYIPIALTIAALVVILALRNSPHNAHLDRESLSVLALNFAGYLVGAVFVGFHKKENELNCGLSDPQKLELCEGINTKESTFIFVTSLFSTTYCVGYHFTLAYFVNQMPTAKPLDEGVVLVTGVTLFAMAFLSMQHACYVKSTKLLENAISKNRKDAVEILRKFVFRAEQLFEPAGNIFVTAGITATFLGLGLGLIMLDPVGIVAAGRASDATGVVPVDRSAITSSLRSFLGCIGLALGMSMLGVVTAMAAQWLRGYGANNSTEDLLKNADAKLAGA